ncbi:MAG TPA: restriction endonuclease [Chryseolinea sp.]
MKPGREFEQLIESIYRDVDPNSQITRNDKIFGHESKADREIDLSIRSKIGIHEILIVVQAKDTNKPIDVNVVYAFIGVIKDIHASKGVLISAKGYSKSAKALCKSYGIDMFTAHDVASPKWTLDLRMPVLLTHFEGWYRPDFRFISNDAYVKMIQDKRAPEIPDWDDFKFTYDNGRSYFTAREEFLNLCTEGGLIYDGGEHQARCQPKVELFITDGVLVPVKDLRFVFSITKREYYKYFEVKEFRGLIDSVSNVLKPAKFRVESEDVVIADNQIRSVQGIQLETWTPVTSKTKLIHPYKIFLNNLAIAIPKDRPRFVFAGNEPGLE